MLKKLIVFSVISLLSVPAPSALAFTLSDHSFEDLVNNVAQAETVDFSVAIDVETMSDHSPQPVALHLDLDGVSDFAYNSAFDLRFRTIDQQGIAQEVGGSLVVTPNAIYLSEDGNEWFFIEQNAASLVSEERDTATDVATFTAFMQEAFEREIITYQAENVDVINGTLAVRYAYAVNNDRLIDYFVDEHILTAVEAAEARASFAGDVAIGGYLWVDAVAMLPVKFSLAISASQSETAYTLIELSVLLNSFNQPVEIDVPENAASFGDGQFAATSDLMMTGIESAVSNMDTDSDGLTNDEEMTTWNTDPLRLDSDADGYGDNTEVVNGYNPNGAGKLDSDGDGLVDYNEMTVHWSDRFDADTDGDGYSDGVEVANGYDPNGPGRW